MPLSWDIFCFLYWNTFSNDLALVLFSQRLKFEIAEVMTEIEQLTCIGERLVTGAAAEMKLAQLYNPSTLVSIKSCCPLSWAGVWTRYQRRTAICPLCLFKPNIHPLPLLLGRVSTAPLIVTRFIAAGLLALAVCVPPPTPALGKHWQVMCDVQRVRDKSVHAVNKQGAASVTKAKSALSSRLLLCHMRRKPTPAQLSVCAMFTFGSDPNMHSRKMDEASPCWARFTWLLISVC